MSVDAPTQTLGKHRWQERDRLADLMTIVEQLPVIAFAVLLATLTLVAALLVAVWGVNLAADILGDL